MHELCVWSRTRYVICGEPCYLSYLVMVLVHSCGFEVMLTFCASIVLSYISCMSRLHFVGETPLKFLISYMCSWKIFKSYMHISRGSSLYLSGFGKKLSILFFMIFKKMGKYIQSSISSPPYALCIKLTWTLLSLQNLVLSSITKKGGDWKHLGP